MKAKIEKIKRQISEKSNIKNKDKNLKQMKKENYEKFSFKKEEIPGLIKSFYTHLRYTYNKLVFSKKLFWIISFISALFFIFIWRDKDLLGIPGTSSAIQSGTIFSIGIFLVFSVLALPILTAYYVSRAYRDERDKGDIIFSVTKKDHKSIVYFAKYTAAILASWTWITFYFLSMIFWILFKILLLLSGNETLESILGVNPDANQFWKVVEVGLVISAISIIVIIFWGSLFLLLSRWLPSRGVVLSSMFVPLMAIIFPLIGTISSDFAPPLHNIQRGEYEVVEYDRLKSEWGDNRNQYKVCTFDWTSKKEIKPKINYKEFEDLSAEWNYDSSGTSSDINKPNEASFKSIGSNPSANDQIMENICKSKSWLDPSQRHFMDESSVEIITNIGNNRDFDANKNMIPVQVSRSYTWSYDILGSRWDASRSYAFNIIKQNNKVGWLSFLNPVYYTSIVLEQPLKMLIPDQAHNFLEDKMKVLSSMFGGRHNAKFSLLDATYIGKEIYGLKNKNSPNANNWADSRKQFRYPSEFAYLKIYNDPQEYDSPYWIGRNKKWPTYHESLDGREIGLIGVPMTTIHNITEFRYDGMQYWINPIGTTFMLIFISLSICYLAIRLNSRHDLSRI